MAHQLQLTASAARDFRGLTREVQQRITRRLDRLALEPRPSGVKKLAGMTGDIYRVRVGDHRILYEVEDQALLILVIRVRNRRDVYR